MRVSKKAEYALHTVLYLCVHPDGNFQLGRLADMQAVSKDYLAKVMQTLSGIGVVRAHPGVGGGYRLARSPFDISIAEVVRPFESAERVFSCLHERRHCEAYPRCVINELMEASVARFYEELESCSFGDLLEKGISDGLKPSWLEAELSREKVRAAGQ